MKKINTLLISFLLISSSLMAQIPEALNFQAIARDQDGIVMEDANLQIRLTITDGADGNAEVYQELRSLTTNSFGSFSFQIGADPDYVTLGAFSDIEWETGEKFIKIDYDPSNQFDWSLTLGTMKFVSVPYAMAAGAVSYIDASNALDGDVLVYNSNTNKFEAEHITPGAQNLSLSGSVLSISEGNSVDLGGLVTGEQNLEEVLNQGASAGGMIISNLSNPINAQDASTKIYVDNKVSAISPKTVEPRIATRGQVVSVSFSGNDNMLFTATAPSSQVVLRYEQASSTINIYPLSSSYIDNKRIDAVFSIPYSAATGTYDVIISPNTSGSHFLDNFFKIF